MTFYLILVLFASHLRIFDVVSFGTFGLTPIEALFPIGTIVLLWHSVWKGLPLRISTNTSMVLLLAIPCVFVLSTLVTIAGGEYLFIVQSIKTTLHFVYIWWFAVVLVLLPINAEQWMSALRGLLAISSVVFLYAIYQLAARAFDLPLAWIEVNNTSFFRGAESVDGEAVQLALQFKDFYRATSIFSEPSALAAYSATIFAMLFIPMVRFGKHILRRKWQTVLLMILALISLFLAFSILGVVLLAAVLLVATPSYRRFGMKKIVVSMAVAACLLFVADVVVENNLGVSVGKMFGQRIVSILDGTAKENEVGAIAGESTSQRVADYEKSVEAWAEAPVFGSGPGNFSKTRAGRTHNSEFPATIYGGVLADLGLFGFTVFVVFLGYTLVAIQVNSRDYLKQDTNAPLQILASFLFVRWLILVLSGFAGNGLVTSEYWLEIGIVLALFVLVRTELGVESFRVVHMVQIPWKNRFVASLGYKNGIVD